jgi:hypothetical protein
MAITNIHAITSTVNQCLNYIKRDKFQLSGDKMERHKTLTSYHNCVESNAVMMFEKQRRYYIDCGRSYKKRLDGSENLAFHMVQSFDKKIEPELANEIGKRLAEEILSEYSCVVSTHSNSDYTHNHFVFNAYKMDGTGKWHDCDKTKDLIRKASDRLCEEYGLSVVEERREYKPIHWVENNGKRRSYEPTARKSKLIDSHVSASHNSPDMIQAKIERSKSREVSFKAMIRADINDALKSASSYTELLQLLSKRGYKINSKRKNGEWLKYVSFLSPDGERPIRDSTLGLEYTRERLTEKISRISENRSMEIKSESPLIKYIRSDIAAKAETVDLIGAYKPTCKTKGKLEYLANCISANLSCINTLGKYNFASFEGFENRMLSVTESLHSLDGKLDHVQRELLKLSGMSSVVKSFGGYETEMRRMMRKYDLLNNFYNECYGCVSNLQRVDRENKKIYGSEIRSLYLLSSAGLIDTRHKLGIISNALDNGLILESEYPICKKITVSPLSTIAKMKSDPDYAAAKAGDNRAAFRFVRSTFNGEEQIRKMKELGAKYPDAIIVGVLAEEAAGKNKIPAALVHRISELTGLEYDHSIYQINKVGRTGSGAAYRMANRPKFTGAVQSGRKYILTDDVVTAGGTLSELRNYIESNGGEVVDVVTGAAAEKSTNFSLSDKTRAELESKYGIIELKNLLRECGIYGGKIEYLTESEGDFLLRFKSIDRARTRILEERNGGFIQDIRSIERRGISERR